MTTIVYIIRLFDHYNSQKIFLNRKRSFIETLKLSLWPSRRRRLHDVRNYLELLPYTGRPRYASSARSGLETHTPHA